MNYIKTTIPKDEYKELEQLGNKYILHILPEESEESIICVETILNEKPTKTQIKKITTEAKAYYDEVQKKATVISDKYEIKELKQKLADTDYIAIKFAEGWITAEDYEPVKQQRQQWRDRINELENSVVEEIVE